METELARLLEPIAEGSPCGEDLEDSQLLASFDAFRVFGRISALEDSNDPQKKGNDWRQSVDWREVRDRSLEALQRSKDFRLLAHLAAARLHAGGVVPFCETLRVAAGWMDRYPDAVYPRVDEDAILRRNALNNFADRISIVDSLRRAPFVQNPQLGAFSLRDHDVATGQLPPPGHGEPPTEAQIGAALTAAATEDLEVLDAAVTDGAVALRSIDAFMRDGGGAAAAPDFDGVLAALDGMHKLLREQLVSRGTLADPAGAPVEGGAVAGEIVVTVGNIRSRDDALRALDAVATFFRRNEPSSPVPVLIDRAKRLVGKDFLEVLADVAPDGVAQARLAGGLREE